jgi:hypothetical protein
VPLSKKEKMALLSAVSFMHNYGENFVPLVKNGTKEENMQAWKEARVIYKELHARIKKTLDS